MNYAGTYPGIFWVSGWGGGVGQVIIFIKKYSLVVDRLGRTSA